MHFSLVVFTWAKMKQITTGPCKRATALILIIVAMKILHIWPGLSWWPPEGNEHLLSLMWLWSRTRKDQRPKEKITFGSRWYFPPDYFVNTNWIQFHHFWLFKITYPSFHITLLQGRRLHWLYFWTTADKIVKSLWRAEKKQTHKASSQTYFYFPFVLMWRKKRKMRALIPWLVVLCYNPFVLYTTTKI